MLTLLKYLGLPNEILPTQNTMRQKIGLYCARYFNAVFFRAENVGNASSSWATKAKLYVLLIFQTTGEHLNHLPRRKCCSKAAGAFFLCLPCTASSKTLDAQRPQSGRRVQRVLKAACCRYGCRRVFLTEGVWKINFVSVPQTRNNTQYHATIWTGRVS